jgi:hypothetical protein
MRSQVNSAGEPIVLELGKSIERQSGNGDSQEYRFALEAGQYAGVTVDQRGIDVAAACFGPDGKQRFATDSPVIGSSESAELVADASGDYRLRLNNEHPEFSGVVLSLADRAGRPQNGFLRLYDIYNLRLAAQVAMWKTRVWDAPYYWGAFTLQGEWR